MVGCLGVLVICAAIVSAIQVGWIAGLIVLVGGFVGVGYLSHRADQKRLADLTQRFGAEVAERIVKKTIWQGATPEMIIESIGEPLDVDENFLGLAGDASSQHVYENVLARVTEQADNGKRCDREKHLVRLMTDVCQDTVLGG